MKQTNATFLVENGVLMADQDQCISIVKARVTVEPADQPAQLGESIKRMERAADRMMKTVIIAFVTYMLLEVVYAFASGAFAQAVR